MSDENLTAAMTVHTKVTYFFNRKVIVTHLAEMHVAALVCIVA